MPSASSSSTIDAKRTVTKPAKAGRNSVTGRFVLVPATNGTRITLADARTAAKSIFSAKK